MKKNKELEDKHYDLFGRAMIGEITLTGIKLAGLETEYGEYKEAVISLLRKDCRK